MKVSIVGTAGIPAAYGGFETLAENLVRYAASHDRELDFVVFCSGSGPGKYHGATLRHLPLSANGVSSVFYDALSLAASVRKDVVLLLGVSGALFLPVFKFFSGAVVITNVDGIEWRRAKWSALASAFLRLSERVAVRFSDIVVADNEEVRSYIRRRYGSSSVMIAYGGDHAKEGLQIKSSLRLELPDEFYLAVCRIEPENNVSQILEAFNARSVLPIVFVGNWESSAYGRQLRAEFGSCKATLLLDPIYDAATLADLRSRAIAYVHGHSAGGTNPSLVEAMHFGRPIIAFDCEFNRCTTEGHGAFFRGVDDLLVRLGEVERGMWHQSALNLLAVAQRRYTWEIVAGQYFELFRRKRLFDLG